MIVSWGDTPMARIIYGLNRQSDCEFQLYTDLDFWDARRLLKDLAVVKRNFSREPSGDDYPTLVTGLDLSPGMKKTFEIRLKRAIASPPRHVIVRSMIEKGSFEFDPAKYYPNRWTKARMIHFTYCRLPLQQSALNTPYQKVRLFFEKRKIIIERVRRKEKCDPVIRSKKEAKQRLLAPSCF